MSKKNKIIIGVIGVIAILAVCVFAYEKTTNKKEENPVVNENVEQEDEQVQEENTVENEVVVDDVVEDPVEEPEEDIQGAQVPSQEITTIPDSISVYQSQSVYEKDSDVGTTNKKEEAIELVKQTWGEDSTVTFSCDSVTTNGEYIIAVTSLETATVRNYFRVNLSTKSVEVEY